MSEQAPAPATESAPSKPAESPDRPPIPTEHKGEPGTMVNRVKALRDQLAAKRSQRMFGPPKAEDDAKPKDEPAKAEPKADAKPDAKPAKEEKREAKTDEKEPAKPKAKDEPASDGRERDEQGRFVAKDGDAKAPAKDEPPKPSEPPPAAAKAQDKPEPPTEEPRPPAAVKEPERKPEQDRTAARLSQTLLELKDAKAKLLEADKTAKRTSHLEDLHKRVSGPTIDGEAFEELNGRSLDQLIKDLAASKLKYVPKTPLAPEVRELRDRLRAMEERDAERERRAQEAEQARQREAQQARGAEIRGKELGSVKTWLKEVEDKFPYLTSHDDAHEQVLDGFYALWRERGGKAEHKPDPEEVAELIEQGYSRRHASTATNRRAMMSLLKDPKVRDLAIEILGLKPQANDTQTRQSESSPQRDTKGNQSAPEEGPRTLSNKVSQDVPAYVKKDLDEEAERKALHERVRAWNRAREAARQ